jgi:hypothetical protein
MTSALEGGEWSAARPGHTLLPGKNPYALYRRLGGPQGRSGQVRKISPPPRFDLRTVQPIASHYTNWATQPTVSYLRPVKNAKIQYKWMGRWVRAIDCNMCVVFRVLTQQEQKWCSRNVDACPSLFLCLSETSLRKAPEDVPLLEVATSECRSAPGSSNKTGNEHET